MIEEFAWKCGGGAETMRSLLLCGQVYTFTSNKLIMPLEMLAKAPSWIEDEDPLSAEFRARISKLVEDNHKRTDGMDKSDLDDVQDVTEAVASADFEATMDLLKTKDIYPCIFFVRYDKDEPDREKRFSVGLTLRSNDSRNRELQASPACWRDLGRIWWHESPTRFIEHAAGALGRHDDIERLELALLIDGARGDDEPPREGTYDKDGLKEFNELLDAFDIILSADIHQAIKKADNLE